MSFSVSKVISGSLLVAGTAIGAGMLALPVATASGGFWPALAMYLLAWAFMAGTALLLLEVCIWMPHDANMVSMSRHILGRRGKILSWFLYLFLFYSLTVAYIEGGGSFFTTIGNGLLLPWQGTLLFVLFFGTIVYFGTKAIHRLNYLLMTGLIVSYLLFVVIGWEYVQTDFLKNFNWFDGTLALPIIFTSFAFQGIVPSLTSYMDRNAKMVRYAILIGSSIPFIAYVIWELLILGVVPVEGPNGLLAAKALGQTAVFPLKDFVNSTWIYPIGQMFVFFALTTSFLGVTLGLVDFFADGLKAKKDKITRLRLCFLVFVPPMLFSMYYPNIFIIALTYAGGIGCALLLGLLPIMLVWTGRYKLGFASRTRQLPGGRVLLFLMTVFVLFEICIEIYQEYMRLSS